MNKAKFKLTEQNYRYLFENASDAMWVRDLDGDIVDANKACEKLTGYTRQEVLAKNIKSFLVGEFLELAKEVRRKLLRGETTQPYEQQLVRKDGSVRTIEMATSLVTINGEPRGFQHIARDITEEKQWQENMHFYVQLITRAQEEERKRIARELHDEASPPLLLLIQRLDATASSTQSRLSKPLKDNLEDLRRQAVEVLEGLRRCAQDLRPRIIDDLGLIAALEWMTENLAKDYGIDAYVEVIGTERSLPAEVELLLFRIAQEALNNIRRHAEASRALAKLEFGDNKIKMTVSDNGKGFELPTQVSNFTSTGKLGITGMYERARLLGGSLKIQSELGKGTQVFAEVPLQG